MTIREYLPVFPDVQSENFLPTLELLFRRSLVGKLGLPHSTEGPYYGEQTVRQKCIVHKYS